VDPADAIARAKDALSPRQRRMFDVIVAAYPSAVSREDVAAQLTSERKPEGLHPRGGSLGEDLGRLAGRGLIEYERGQYRARDFLFAGATR
jgi:hypothetical protein